MVAAGIEVGTAILGALLAIAGFLLGRKTAAKAEGVEAGNILAELKNLTLEVKELKLDLKEIKREYNELSNRVTKVETTQSHK